MFRTGEHGYNLVSLYAAASNYIDRMDSSTSGVKNYHYCLIIVQTSKDEVFGAFITAFPAYDARVNFLGTAESFVFRVKPGEFECFQRPKGDPNGNYFFLHLGLKTLVVGSGGKGPAFSLDEELFAGRTNQCETFDSPPLIPGERHIDDAFQAKNIEVFIL
jgi:hypothetical protein